MDCHVDHNSQDPMELECAKYHDKVSSDAPACAHPGDYCQFRSSCMIHFMEGELRRSRKEKATAANDSTSATDREDDRT